MTIVTKGKILRQDLELWDGVNKTAVRKDSTGGTVSGLVLGYEVDVLASYGNGENYTWQTINDCVRRIGSASVTLIFNPGTWTIDQDLTIGSNFTCRIPAGCVFNVSSGKTLTFSGPVIRDSSTWTSGSGTVTENGTRTFTGLIDLTGAVIQGTNALVFEGSTDNVYETTLVITNPTADRTLTIPDADVDLSALPSLSGNNTWSGNQIFAGTLTMSGKSMYWAKGADIASAATLVLGTDGNMFDITGTTGPITAITVPAGMWFQLQFDSTPTLNYHATNLNLNTGGDNYIAAAGDRFIGFATAANQVTGCFVRASGQPVAGYPASQGSSWTLVDAQTGGGEVTGMDGSFDQYVFVANGMRINTDAQAIALQVGDGTGYKTSGYQYHVGVMSSGSALYASYNSGSDTDIQIAGSMGNASDEVMTFVLFIDNPASTTLKKLIHGTGCFLDSAGASIGITVTGNWNGGVTAITKVKVSPALGVIDSGNFYLYGIKKA